MANVPNKIADRLSGGLKRFQPILSSAKSRDVGESDTVTVVVDMLAEIFGYDKYSEITSEYSIRGTYCDLATKIEVTQFLPSLFRLLELHGPKRQPDGTYRWRPDGSHNSSDA